MKALAVTFNQEKALGALGAFSVIVKTDCETDCETDGALHSTSHAATIRKHLQSLIEM